VGVLEHMFPSLTRPCILADLQQAWLDLLSHDKLVLKGRALVFFESGVLQERSCITEKGICSQA
jgi:hypothetical protein